MRFPPTPARFTDRVTAVATLSIADNRTAPLDCLIDVSNVAAHGIVGWILGNSETRDQIERIQRADGAMQLRASTGSEIITSQSVWIHRTQSFGPSDKDMPHGLVGIVCEFECLDLTRRFDTTNEPQDYREVRFLLSGPRVAGLVAWMHTRSFDGSSEVRILNSRLATRGGLHFSMFVLPHFSYTDETTDRDTRLHDNANFRDTRVTTETHMLALACRTREPPGVYADERFLDESRRASEDMCLLLSLLAGGMITWHAYYQSGLGFSIRHNRSLAGLSDEGRHEELIDRQHLRHFLKTGFHRLRRMREQGCDLEMPIVYAIAGARARVARQRLGEFFIALEALHSIFLQSQAAAFLIDKRAFKMVQEILKRTLAPTLRGQGIRSLKVRDQMVNKLPELNRPSLWRGLQSLMEQLRVDWEDLYPEPPPNKPTFINLRNSLFHSHARVDDEIVYKESVRLEGVVHRILLRWLGWENLWHAPPPWVRNYVSGKSLPDTHRLTGRPRRTRKRM